MRAPSDPTASPHDRHARRFPAERWVRLLAHHRRSLAPPEHYVARAPIPRGATVLDAGSGPGYFTTELARAAGPRGLVVAADAQWAMLDVLVRPRTAPDVPPTQPPGPDAAPIVPVVADLTALPLPRASVDAVWWACCAHEVEPLERGCAELRRVLRPGGILIVVEWLAVPTEHGPPPHERLPSSQLRAALQAAGFVADLPSLVTDSQVMVLAW